MAVVLEFDFAPGLVEQVHDLKSMMEFVESACSNVKEVTVALNHINYYWGRPTPEPDKEEDNQLVLVDENLRYAQLGATWSKNQVRRNRAE